MAEANEGKPGEAVDGSLELAGLEPGEEFDLQVEMISPDGRREPLKLDGKRFQLPGGYEGKGYAVEVRSAAGGEGRRVSFDSLAERLRKDPAWRIPKGAWQHWPLYFHCVTGHVERCRPWWWDLVAVDIADLSTVRRTAKPALNLSLANVSTLIEPGLLERPSIIFPFPCRPVCRGKVEVFVRECCCPIIFDPPVIIKDLCEIIDCYPKPKIPDIDLGDPPPFRPPRPGPDPAPDLLRSVKRALQRSAASESARSEEEILAAAQHMHTLQSMSYAAGVEYIKLHPDLHYLHCHCTTTKVATVYLEEDGHFDACFLLGRPRFGCTRRVQYRVSQLQESGWVTIYDGLATNQTFDFDDDAELRANWYADICHDPHDWGPVPFAILEKIGGTWADNLIHSTGQVGEDAAGLPRFGGPLTAFDGLVNPGPLGTTGGPFNQPWAQTLALFYQFHPGLEGLGAKYYRTRAIRVGANGAPLTGAQAFSTTLTGDLSWRKYYNPPGPDTVGVQWVPLHNAAIGGEVGLYTIPYPDLVYPWLNGQAHAYVDTSGFPNGRYLIVLDLFNAAGDRLVPNNSDEPAGGGEVSAAFEFRRLDGPIDAAFSNTSVVEHRQLASLFHVDNLPAFGEIEQIMHGSAASPANCQFLTGPSTDTVSLKYEAYQANNFLWYSRIHYKQGLTGPVTYLAPETANVGPPAQQSDTLTFGDLLGAEMRCAFAANLDVYVRHTNGSGRITQFDRHDQAAFALEQTP